jgi:hypothetical protein
VRQQPTERQCRSTAVRVGRFGIHWPEIDEDLELADLLLRVKAPGAKPPVKA